MEPVFIVQAISYCLENNIYNANNLVEAGIHYQKQQAQEEKVKLPWKDTGLLPMVDTNLYEPQGSKISTYEKVM